MKQISKERKEREEKTTVDSAKVQPPVDIL